MQHDGLYYPQLEAKLRTYGLSVSASQWLAKAMHPVSGPATAIPDAIQVSALVPEYKTNTVLGIPGSLGAVNWDLCLIFPPSDTVAFYWAAGPQGIDFRVTAATMGGTVYNANYVSNITPATNLLVNVSNIAAPVFATVSSGSLVAQSVEQPAMWRTAARSATVYSTGSDLYNQGTVYAGQYARVPLPQPTGVLYTGTQFNIDSIAIPLSEVDMAVITPGMYTAPAREGVYSVGRLTGPAQEFVVPRGSPSYMDNNGGYLLIGITNATTVGGRQTGLTMSLPSYVQPDGHSVSPAFPAVTAGASTGFDAHFTWGVAILRGLHPNQSITVKTDTVLEIVPLATAPSRQFVLPPAKYEPTAIAAYYALASEVPDCMAAKHNFLGTLLPILSSVASKVLPFLAPAASELLTGLARRISPPQKTQEGAVVRAQAVARGARVQKVKRQVKKKRVTKRKTRSTS